MILDWIEIGTSDFDTLIQKSPPELKGMSIEPIKEYLDNLPTKDNVVKVNKAISNVKGNINIYYIPPSLIKSNKLPDWVRGCNSINKPHPTVQKLLNNRFNELVKIEEVECITWGELISQYNIEGIKYLKLDTEGHDTIILEDYYKECKKNPKLLANTIFFEYNILSDSNLADKVIESFIKLGYKGKRVGENYQLQLNK